MHPDRDFDAGADPPERWAAVARDLELDTLVSAMAGRDTLIATVAAAALAAPASDRATIAHRQAVLADCLAHPALVRSVYALAAQGAEAQRKVRLGWLRDSPESLLRGSVQVLELLVGVLRGVRETVTGAAPGLASDGWTTLAATLARDLDDAYLDGVSEHLRTLRFRGGVLMGARLGAGGRGTANEVLLPRRRGLVERLTPRGRGYTFRIPDRDEAALRALSELRGRGLVSVAGALGDAADQVVGFLDALRTEAGFYLGCVNLRDRLAVHAGRVCVPAVADAGAGPTATGLYDPCLALHLDGPAVGNDIDAADRPLLVVTGANGGGKSSFLRALGVAQVMLESGMFVAADTFAAGVGAGVLTHFRREEDAGLERGRLDDELRRMSAIVDDVRPGGLVLLNESFATTNEREGSEIARQVVRALVEGGVRVALVTHLHELAHGLWRDPPAPARFLRAAPERDGVRTYRLDEAEPQPTSHGEDAYRRVFGHGLGAPQV
jgi:MutS domain V